VVVGLFCHVLFVFPFQNRINTGTALFPEEQDQVFNPKISSGPATDGSPDDRPLVMGPVAGDCFTAGAKGDNGNMDGEAKIIAGIGQPPPKLAREIQRGGQAADRSRDRHEVTKIQA